MTVAERQWCVYLQPTARATVCADMANAGPGRRRGAARPLDAGDFHIDSIMDRHYAEPGTGMWDKLTLPNGTQSSNPYIYRVAWKGYGREHDSWEPQENFHCVNGQYPDIIKFEHTDTARKQDVLSCTQGQAKAQALTCSLLVQSVNRASQEWSRAPKTDGTVEFPRLQYGSSDRRASTPCEEPRFDSIMASCPPAAHCGNWINRHRFEFCCASDAEDWLCSSVPAPPPAPQCPVRAKFTNFDNFPLRVLKIRYGHRTF